MPFPTIIFLLIGLISGAGALLSFTAYRRAKIAAFKAKIAAFKTRYPRLPPLPPNSDTDIPDVSEIPEVPDATAQVTELEAKLEVAKTTIADLKTAVELAPEPKGCGKHKKPVKKKGSVK